MKFSFSFSCLRRALPVGLFILTVLPLLANRFKANNNSGLESGASWVGGVAPTAGDNAIWDATVSTSANATNTLGSAAAWNGIVISNPLGAPLVGHGSVQSAGDMVGAGSRFYRLQIQ
jgi:hypothetical protein